MTRTASALLFCLFSLAHLTHAQSAADDFAVAAGLHDRGLHERAVRAFRDFLETHGDDGRVPRAHFYLGESLVALERDSEALPHYEAHARDRRSDMRRHANLRCGEILLRQDQAGRAYKRLSRLLQREDLGELEEAALYFFAEAANADGKIKEAADAYRRLLSSHADGVYFRHASVALGTIELAAKRAEEALGVLTPVASSGRDELTTEAQLLLGEAWLQADKPSKAADMFERAAKKAPRRAAAGHARALFAAGDGEAAVRRLRAVLVDSSEDALLVRTAVRLAALMRDDGRADLGAALLDGIEGGRGQDAEDVAYWRGLLAADLGDTDRGVEELERAVAADASPERRFSLADTLSRAGRFEKAAGIFASLRKSKAAPGLRYEATYAEAFARSRLGEHDAAARLLSTLDRDGVSDALRRDAIFALAEAHFGQGRLDRAARQYGRCTDPGHPRRRDAAYKLGWCTFELERYDEALEALAGVVAVDGPWRDEAVFLSAKCEERLGRFAGARRLFESLGRAGGAVAARGLLGAAAMARREGKPAEARRLAARAAELADSQELAATAAWEGAEAAWEEGDLQGAIRAYRDFLESHPAHERAAEAHLGLAWALRESGELIDSVASALAACEGEATVVEARYVAALGTFDQGLHEAALQHIAAARAREEALTRAAELELLEGLSRARMGQHAKAVTVLTAYLGRGDGVESRALALYELAFAAEGMGDAKRREAALRELIVKYPTSPRAADSAFRLAETLYERKAFADALALYEKAVESGGAEAVREPAIYKASWCLRRLERHADAARSFARLAADGDFAAEASYLAGDAWTEAEQHEAALACFEHVTRKHPQHEYARAAALRRILALAALERHGEVVQAAARVVVTDDSDVDAWAVRVRSALGDSLMAQESWGRAVTAYRAVTKASSGPLAARAQFRIGRALMRASENSKAVDELLKVTILYSHDPWVARATLEAAKLLESLGEAEKALRLYRDVVREHGETAEGKAARAAVNKLNKGE